MCREKAELWRENKEVHLAKFFFYSRKKLKSSIIFILFNHLHLKRCFFDYSLFFRGGGGGLCIVLSAMLEKINIWMGQYAASRKANRLKNPNSFTTKMCKYFLYDKLCPFRLSLLHILGILLLSQSLIGYCKMCREN